MRLDSTLLLSFCLAVGSPLTNAASLPDGLVAWYAAEDNANDSAGPNNGALVNGVTFAPGKVGQAFSFDGLDGHVSLGNPTALKLTDSMSIGAWINPRDIPSTGLTAIVTKWAQDFHSCGPGSTADSYGLFLQKQNNSIQLFSAIHLSNLSEPNLTGGTIPTNVFSHVAMTYDATAGLFNIYVNGIQVNTSSFTPSQLCTSEKNVLIGGEDSFLPRRFPGLIDEVQIFNRALSASEVKQLVDGASGNTNPPPSCVSAPPGLVSWWRAENSAADSQGANKGTLHGGVTYAPGKAGTGFSFSGSGDYVEVPTNGIALGGGDFTLEGWIKPNRGDCAIFSFGPPIGGTTIYLQNTEGDLVITHSAGAPAGTGFNDGQFHHFAVVKQGRQGIPGGTVAYYKDGAKVGEVDNNVYDLDKSPPYYIGSDLNPANTFSGIIDELSFYNRALSGAEIQIISGAGSAGKCPVTNSIPVRPTLTNAAPASGPAGSLVILSGTGFSSVPASNRVDFDGVTAIVLSATTSELAVILPSTVPLGPSHAAVTVGTNQSDRLNFEVAASTSLSLNAAKLSGAVFISWTSNSTGAVLESTVDLNDPVVWTSVTNVPALQGDQFSLQVSLELKARFFRLRSDSSPDALDPTLPSSGSALILASTGGTVTTADKSATLDVPPGAISQDTQITVTALKGPDQVQNPGGDIVLAPAGLTFSKPALLIIQTPVNPPADAHLDVQILSGSNTPQDVGGEGSFFAPVTNFTRSADGQLTVPLDHFSLIDYGWWAKYLYAVLDIPGKYLRKTDLLYVLTGANNHQGGSWTPGHTGMYLGAKDGFSGQNDGDTIIESTSTNKFLQGSVRFDSLGNETGIKNFGGGHIYMGARRPSLFETTESERVEIAEFAIGALGKPYAITGGAFLANGSPLYEGYSCVGLTELAYEFGAGKRIVPWQIARLLLSPLRQFLLTRPVNSAEIEVGETIDAKLTGIVNIGTFASEYHTEETRYTRLLDLDASNSNARDAVSAGRAKFEPVFGGFTFTPASVDGGKDFKFALKVDATQSGVGKETAFFTVSVKKTAVQFVRKDPPSVQTFFVDGNLDLSNITASANEVSTSGYSGPPRLRITWDPPPQTLSPGATFSMQLHADAGANPTPVSVAYSAPYLAGQINDSVDLSQNPAFAGYEYVGVDNTGRVFKLVQRSLTKDVTVGDNPFVELEFRVFRTFGPAIVGQVGAKVTWNYVPAP